MKTDPQLHHAAKRVAPQSLERVIEVFELLGCKMLYRPENARWAMIGQDGLHFDIQLTEVAENPTLCKSRTSSHIAFISNNPTEQVSKIEEWAITHNLRFEKGAWNEKELWFDFPDLFVDFVIEIMHVSVTES